MKKKEKRKSTKLNLVLLCTPESDMNAYKEYEKT